MQSESPRSAARLASRATVAACLLAILALGAYLRFAGLGWGLRHALPQDERYFVESTGWMLAEGDLDHRFYEYPGLMFYLLAPVLAFHHPPALGAPAYLAARALVAAAGVLSVGLVFQLAARLVGPGAALGAALLLAVSPIEVQTAHMVRPDVVLETFVLLAFLSFLRVGPERRGDALAGLALGAAMAVKFSGVLLAPCYVLRRLLAPAPSGPSLPRFLAGRLLLAGVVAAVAFILFSPYSVLHFGAAIDGVRTQVAHHYVERGRGPQTFAGIGVTYGLVLFRAMGFAAAALTAAGTLLSLRDWRRFAPLLALPLLMLVVFSTAEVQRARFFVPALGILSILAARALAAISNRSAAAAVAVALLAALHPLRSSLDYVAGISHPSTRDQVLDWIETYSEPGSRILTSQRDLGIDRARHEVLEVDRIEEAHRPLALDVDLVVSGREDDADLGTDLQTLYRAEPATVHSGHAIRIAKATVGLDSRFQRLKLNPRSVTTSESSDHAAALVDGRPETAWRTAEAQRPGVWIEVKLGPPAVIGRIEMRLAGRRLFARNVHVYVTTDEQGWNRVAVMQGRPPVDDQPVGSPPRQILVFAPVTARGLRLVQVGQRERPWAVSELEVWAVR